MEVIFHRLATQEYLRAIRWFSRRSQNLADSFQNAVDAAVQRIAATPNIGGPYDQYHRWMRVGRFSYLLYYTIMDDSRIVIKAVAHSSRRSGYWRRRRP